MVVAAGEWKARVGVPVLEEGGAFVPAFGHLSESIFNVAAAAMAISLGSAILLVTWEKATVFSSRLPPFFGKHSWRC
jgi:hypothetical protein